MNWFKRRCVCEECHVVFEPLAYESQFNRWCAEHRKPHREKQVLLDWAASHLDEVRKLRDEYEAKRAEVLKPLMAAQQAAMAAAQFPQGSRYGYSEHPSFWL